MKGRDQNNYYDQLHWISFRGYPPLNKKVSHLKESGEVSDTCHVGGASCFLPRNR
jgi:hypothetical protein